jgi:phenylacetate-CoA ligase
MLGTWEQMFHLIGLRPGDRLFFAFSFGPFISFWTAFESALRLGYQCLASGGMSSGARLRYLLDNAATLVLCTPTYALRLAEIARKEDINLAESPVRGLIVGGETGGSIPATRALIEKAWAARVFDHSGMTETGPVGQECHANPFGLHLVETDFLAEVIDPETGRAVPPGQDGELVLTTLGRWGSPLVRYRTGDLVRIDPQPCRCGSPFLRLDGGILGRIDDLIHVRGVNVYPSALEEVLRRFPDVIEFRLEITQQAEMPTLRLEVEPATAEGAGDLVRRLAQTIRDELFFRPEIRAVAPGTLPRYEMKARRVIKKN